MSSALELFKKLRLMHMLVAITFFTSGLIINVMQLILHLCLKPFNKRLYRSLNWYLCYSLYSQLVFVADWWSKSKLIVFMDEEDMKKYPGKEHVLLIMNHTYEIDWLAGWIFTEKSHVLGNCKAYAKKVISYVPVIGWAWKFAEFIFLERSYDKDKEIIAHQIKEIFDYPDPVWLLLNAEGTRFTEAKHEASVKFAQERGMTVLKHHLIPRTKGFTTSLPHFRGRCPVIYDISLVFKKDDPIAPTMSNVLWGHSITGYMFARRIPFENVPEDEKEAAEWLQNLYREKDRLIDSFHTTGSFFETSGFKETKSFEQKPRLYTLFNFLFWAIVSITPLFYYLANSILAQNWTGFSIAIGILVCFYVLLQKAIGASKISKASSYGSDASSTNSHLKQS